MEIDQRQVLNPQLEDKFDKLDEVQPEISELLLKNKSEYLI